MVGGQAKNGHTFVICAYKESPYLEECIKSLLRQSVSSKVILVTSTPNGLISSMAEKYQMEMYVNEGQGGCSQDFNFALMAAKSKYVTIAHQDDVYEKDYLKSILKQLRKKQGALIAFTDYYEIRSTIRVDINKIAQIKRLMLLPLKLKCLWGSRIVRRMILSFGDPICCPSVTYCMERLRQPVFAERFRNCEDWDAMERISREKGDFVYICQRLLGHRIHEDSTTSEMIKNKIRKKEEYEIFCRFWPKCFAKILGYFYAKAEKSNEL